MKKQLKDKIVDLDYIDPTNEQMCAIEALAALNLLVYLDSDFEQKVTKILTNDYDDISDLDWNWVALVLSLIDKHLVMSKFGKMVKSHVFYAFEHLRDQEEFKTLKYNGNVLEVGTKGTIKMGGKKIQQRDLGNGYLVVNLPGSKSIDYVHKIVCQAFYGRRRTANKVIDHINGVTWCNFAENLHYVTRKENYANRPFAPKRRIFRTHSEEMIICEAKKDNRRYAFKTVKEASEKLKIPAYQIYRVLNPDDWPKSAHGFKFSTLKIDTFNKNFK